METRTALLNSAEKACRSRGYNGFSYADLSKEVGIRKASIHHHFPAKADLAYAVLERYTENFFAKLEEIEANEQTAGKQLKAYVEAYRDALDGGESVCLCVAFSAGRENLSEPVLIRLNLFHMDSIAWLKRVFKRGKNDGTINAVDDITDEASACLATMEGAQLMARAAKVPGLFDHAVRGLLKRIK